MSQQQFTSYSLDSIIESNTQKQNLIKKSTFTSVWNAFVKWIKVHTDQQQAVFIPGFGTLFKEYESKSLQLTLSSQLIKQESSLQQSEQPKPFRRLPSILIDFEAIQKTLPNLSLPEIKAVLSIIFSEFAEILLRAEDCEIQLGILGTIYCIGKSVQFDPFNKHTLVEKFLVKLDKDSEYASVDLKMHGNTGQPVVSDQSISDINLNAEEMLVQIQTLRNCPYSCKFEPKLAVWQEWLQSSIQLFDTLQDVQNIWKEIKEYQLNRKLLLDNARMDEFEKIERELQDSVLNVIRINPLVRAFTSERNHLLDCLQKIKPRIEGLQHQYHELIESRRQVFPKFSLLSRDDFLSVLEGKPLQPLLKIMFQGIGSFLYDDDQGQEMLLNQNGSAMSLISSSNTLGSSQALGENGRDILGIVSVEGECIAFDQRVSTQRLAVENWLNQVEQEVKIAVQKTIIKAIEDRPKMNRSDWALANSSQSALVANKVYWTQEVEQAKRNQQIRKLINDCEDQLTIIAQMIRGQKLGLLQRRKFELLIIQKVHNKDFLLNQQVRATEEDTFEWHSQLRFYYSNVQTLHIMVLSGKCNYGFDYIGTAERLVLTPVTDRCFASLCAAMNMCKAGAVLGVAGVGKTETVKELSKQLGMQTVTVNSYDCSEYDQISKLLFKLAAVTGVWICFDEFNRIDPNYLGIFSQQLEELLNKKKQQSDLRTFEFFNIFITIGQPSNCRHQKIDIPLSLKQHLREFFLVQPDRSVIIQTLLYSQGFQEGGKLAKMLVNSFRLAMEIITPQFHQDNFGLRSVRTVLKTLSQLRLQFPNEPEPTLAVQALLDSMAPSFSSQDKIIFTDILQDLFPDVASLEKTKKHHEQILTAYNQVLHELHLSDLPYQLEKMLQLYKMLDLKQGIVIVGKPFGGKSSSVKILGETLNTMHAMDAQLEREVLFKKFNPKSIPLIYLYGYYQDGWQDGLFTSIIRRFTSTTPPPDQISISSSLDDNCRRWIAVDGMCDPIILESLNSLLDNSRYFLIETGEKFQLKPYMNMLFETDAVHSWPPAQLSRCGIVYCEPERMGWKHLYKRWLHQLVTDGILHNEDLYFIDSVILTTLDEVIDFQRCNTTEELPTQDQTLVVSLLRIFSGLLKDYFNNLEGVPPRKFFAQQKNQFQLDQDERQGIFLNFYIFALIWSVGSTIQASGRKAFDQFVRRLVMGNDTLQQVRLPLEGQLFDYGLYEDLPVIGHSQEKNSFSSGSLHDSAPSSDKELQTQQQLIKWKQWEPTSGSIDYMSQMHEYLEKRRGPSSGYDVNGAAHMIYVETKETLRANFLMRLNVLNGWPSMLCGAQGTCKFSLIKTLLQRLESDNYFSIKIPLAPCTKLHKIRILFSEIFEKRRQGFYGPTLQSKCVVFVDDLNLARTDMFGAQPALELFRSLMDMGGWHELTSFEFIRFEDLVFVGALNVNSGKGFAKSSQIPLRFTRHLSHFISTPFEEASVWKIFSTVLHTNFATRHFPLQLQQITDKIVQATAAIYKFALAEMPHTSLKPHYIFGLKQFSAVICGISEFECPPAEDQQQQQQQKAGDQQQQQKKDNHQSHPNFFQDTTQNQTATQSASLARLWTHEIWREYSDRLITNNERIALLRQIRATVAQVFNMDFSALFTHLKQHKNKQVTIEEMNRLLFTDLQSSRCEEMVDIPKFQQFCHSALEKYNSENSYPIDILLFDFALQHLITISRVLKQSGGSAILAGVGGSGKQSLTKFAAYLRGIQLLSIDLPNYNLSNWYHSDLKQLIQQTGAQDHPMVLLLSGASMADADVLSDVSVLLKSGDILSICEPEQLKHFITLSKRNDDGSSVGRREDLHQQSCKSDRLFSRSVQTQQPQQQQQQPQQSSYQLYTSFSERVRRNLHVIFTLTTTDAQFREIAESFPTLVTQCCVDQFMDWPRDALIQVAHRFFETIDDQIVSPEDKTTYARLFQIFHDSAKQWAEKLYNSNSIKLYVPPGQFIETLNLFQTIFTSKWYDTTSTIQKYQRGHQKLAEVAALASSNFVPHLQKERENWAAQISKFQQRLENLYGDVLLATAIVNYLGPFSPHFRKQITEEWQARILEENIAMSLNFSINTVLGDPVQILMWKRHGLPADPYSVQNALIAFNSNKWPLFIDPHEQASNWIKQLEADKNLQVLQQHETHFFNIIQKALLFGYPVLIVNVEEQLNSSIFSILQKQHVLRKRDKKGGYKSSDSDARFIRFNHQLVQYSPDFRLYITSRSNSPHFLPQVQAIVNLINFSFTPSNLEGQLQRVMLTEIRPTLLKMKESIIAENQHAKVQLTENQMQILQVLAEYSRQQQQQQQQGIKETEEKLIHLISISQKWHQQNNIKQGLFDAVQQEIDFQLLHYVGISQLAADLFFTVQSLQQINSVYQYSLQYYLNVYRQSLKRVLNRKHGALVHDLDEVIENLRPQFLTDLFTEIGSSLFGKDKFTFAILIALGVLESQGKLDKQHVRFFLSGGTPLMRQLPALPQSCQGLTINKWEQLVKLSALSGFFNVHNSFYSSYQLEDATTDKFDPEVQHSLGSFPKLILQSLVASQDKPMQAMIIEFVEKTLLKLVNEKVLQGFLLEEEHGGLMFSSSFLDRETNTTSLILRQQQQHQMMLQQQLIQQQLQMHGNSGSSVGGIVSTNGGGINNTSEDTREQDFDRYFSASSCTTPILFIYEQGMAPTQTFSKQIKQSNFQHVIDLSKIAYFFNGGVEQTIRQAMSTGTMILLHNIHIAAAYWPTLLQIISEMRTFKPDRVRGGGWYKHQKIHENFRLWMTTKASEYLPSSILQASLKATFQRPRQLQQQLLDNFALPQIQEAFKTAENDRVQQQLIFNQCVFHSVLQIRKELYQLGWSSTCDFAASDLIASVQEIVAGTAKLPQKKSSSSGSGSASAMQQATGSSFIRSIMKVSSDDGGSGISIQQSGDFGVKQTSGSGSGPSSAETTRKNSQTADEILHQGGFYTLQQQQEAPINPLSYLSQYGTGSGSGGLGTGSGGMHQRAQDHNISKTATASAAMQAPRMLSQQKKIIVHIHYGAKVSEEKDRKIIESLLEDWISEEALVQQRGIFENFEKFVNNQSPRLLLDQLINEGMLGLSQCASYALKVGEIEKTLSAVKSCVLDNYNEQFFHTNKRELLSICEIILLELPIKLFSLKEVQRKFPVYNDSGLGTGTGTISITKSPESSESLFSSERPQTGIGSSTNIGLGPAPYTLNPNPVNSGNSRLCNNNNALNFLLLQELKQFNRQVGDFRAQVENLQAALLGTSVMSDNLRELAIALYNGKAQAQQIASTLIQRYSAKTRLRDYLIDLKQRYSFFSQWITEGTPTTFWISAFSMPQKLFHAISQNYAKKNKVSLDQVVFDFQMMPNQKEPLQPMEEGALISGVYIEGAKWNYTLHCLDDQNDEQCLFSNAPIIWIKPVLQQQCAKFACYSAPLYQTSDDKHELTNNKLITWVKIPSEKPESYWIKRNVALFTQIDELI